MKGEYVSKKWLIEESIRIEQDVLKDVVIQRSNGCSNGILI